MIRLGVAATLAALALAGGASAATLPPVLKLDTVLVQQGKAVVSGTVHVAADNLQINGVTVTPDASGGFDAVVDLNTTSGGILLSLLGAHSEAITVRVPVGLLGEGVGVSGLLDELARAGTTVEVPSDGFVMLDGTMPLVTLRVLDRDRLASLTVNGREILALLGPGGSLSLVPSANESNTVVVTTTDRHGVSQTSTFTTRRVVSAIRTAAGLSVSAAGALGVRIANVRVDKSRLRTHRLLRVTLTVKDRRGLLVRGAAVRLRGEPGRYVVNGPQRVGFTNRTGKATFGLTLKRDAFRTAASRRLALLLRATTQRSATTRRVPVLLPKLRPA